MVGVDTPIAFEVDIKSLAPATKTPVQLRLERQMSPKKGASPANLWERLAKSEEARKAALSARADKCREKSEKIKESLEQKKEAFSDLSNKQAESINEKMANAEARRAEENERQLLKVRQMNNRVSEAEKKRGEIEPHDMSTKEAKIQLAEERKAAILKETQEKGAAEIAKAKELAEKKAQKLVDMDETLKAKMTAAEDRRQKLINEIKEKAVMSASPARTRSSPK